MAISKDEQVLKNNCPHIVVGTPGRILALVKSKKLSLKNLKHFVLDECDKMLEQLGKWNIFIWTRFCTNETIFRHEKRCPGNLPRDSSREASDDVQCHPEQGHQTCLQEVHARCKISWRSFLSHRSWLIRSPFYVLLQYPSATEITAVISREFIISTWSEQSPRPCFIWVIARVTSLVPLVSTQTFASYPALRLAPHHIPTHHHTCLVTWHMCKYGTPLGIIHLPHVSHSHIHWDWIMLSGFVHYQSLHQSMLIPPQWRHYA